MILFAGKSEARVFFSLEKDGENGSPWRSCYTGSVKQAMTVLRNKEFSGGTDTEIRSLKSKNNFISFDPYYLGTKLKHVVLKPCIFTEKEIGETVQCEITLQTPQNDGPRSNLGNYIKEIAILWKKGGYTQPIIDCKEGRSLNIRNTWHQPVSVASVKVMSEISKKYKKPLINFGQGFVKLGGSLNPFQNWSGNVHVDFMSELRSAELYDAGVEQLSVPSEVERWIKDPATGGAWTPWIIQIVNLKCDGFAEITDSTAKEWTELDMKSIEIRKYCAQTL